MQHAEVVRVEGDQGVRHGVERRFRHQGVLVIREKAPPGEVVVHGLDQGGQVIQHILNLLL